MNAGETSMRVYAALKERVVGGGFRPGERLDPGRLAEELLSSTTPVRDALHRLKGERLVESWRQEGFRQPGWTETAIRDLYEWSGDVLSVVARSAHRHGVRGDSPPHPTPYAERVAALFRQIAFASPNDEHRAAIEGLLDRSSGCHRAETAVLDDPESDVLMIKAAFTSGTWPELRLAIERFHRRRLRQAHRIAIALRNG